MGTILKNGIAYGASNQLIAKDCQKHLNNYLMFARLVKPFGQSRRANLTF